MGRDGTDARTETGQPGRALVALERTRPEALSRRATGGRPMAGFLTQVMIAADPALRPARSERTRTAASLYARTDDAPAAPRRRSASGLTV